MRLCIIGPSRFPIAEPFAGGLEAHTHALVSALTARGHQITLFAAEGSDPNLGVEFLDVPVFESSEAARNDVGALPEQWMGEHHAYLSLMLDLAEHGDRKYDAVLNTSIHHLPVAMSRMLRIPLITTLHTPPVGWLESAIQVRGELTRFIAVSAHTRDAWAPLVQSTAIRNGVDTGSWQPGPGGGPAIWFGRIVPEKGTHLAIRAARAAGIPLDLAGPIYDRAYFRTEIEPLLTEDIRYLGHLDHVRLRAAVGHARAALVTPRWDEPYGLVAAEALASGTPVAAFRRGALPEILTERCGRLAEPDDVTGLAGALQAACLLDRSEARVRAEAFCSHERMVAEYETLLQEASTLKAAA
ncbi:glycosyltransferase [Arthrobacter koreensis]|uniref:glycosyltransferase n=1 Tax=Arthrobacter TaxID=1663 RepID=UPI000A9565E8|nr:glycosyltransferase [Arthrobacter koreensis]MEB7447159.1 glycosyltransferase [Arthrobacter koreensis]